MYACAPPFSLSLFLFLSVFLMFRVQGLWFRVHYGFGFRVYGLGFIRVRVSQGSVLYAL